MIFFSAYTKLSVLFRPTDAHYCLIRCYFGELTTLFFLSRKRELDFIYFIFFLQYSAYYIPVIFLLCLVTHHVMLVLKLLTQSSPQRTEPEHVGGGDARQAGQQKEGRPAERNSRPQEEVRNHPEYVRRGPRGRGRLVTRPCSCGLRGDLEPPPPPPPSPPCLHELLLLLTALFHT